jgi:stage II sporulation protein AA (anti-sigma F factor antagonist)
MCTLSFFRKDSTLRVKVKGELDDHAANMVRRAIDAQIRTEGIRRLILDLSELTFMDSAGIGVILGRYKELVKRGAVLEIDAANEGIRRILRLAGIHHLIRIRGGAEGKKEA